MSRRVRSTREPGEAGLIMSPARPVATTASPRTQVSCHVRLVHIGIVPCRSSPRWAVGAAGTCSRCARDRRGVSLPHLGYRIVQHATRGPEEQPRDADSDKDIGPDTVESRNEERRDDDRAVRHEVAPSPRCGITTSSSSRTLFSLTVSVASPSTMLPARFTTSSYTMASPTPRTGWMGWCSSTSVAVAWTAPVNTPGDGSLHDSYRLEPRRLPLPQPLYRDVLHLRRRRGSAQW